MWGVGGKILKSSNVVPKLQYRKLHTDSICKQTVAVAAWVDFEINKFKW